MTQPTSQTLRTNLAAAIASMCFGASVVATRFAVAQTKPVSLAFLRYAIGSLCLAPIMPLVIRRIRARTMPARDVIAIAALGIVFFGFFPWSFSASLTFSPSSRVAIVLATMPLLTLIISRLRGYDRVTPTIVIGQLLAFSGLFIALRPQPGAVPNASSRVWIGDLLAGTTALCGAIYNVFSRPYLKRYPPLEVTTLSMVAGMLFLASIAGSQGMFSAVPVFTPSAWMAVLFLGTLGGAFGFALWIWALQRSTPSRVAVFIALNPITAITLGVVLLHEPVTRTFIVGLVAVIAGIVVANWQPRDVVKQ